MTGAEPAIDLDALLNKRAADTQDQTYVDGGMVPNYPTLPLAAGIRHITAFAHECWTRNLRLQRDMIERRQATNEAIRKLDLAEQALRRLTDARGLNKEVAVALAAVQSARELL